MSSRILLDLNFPKFQDDLLALESDELRVIVKTLRKLRSMEWNGMHCIKIMVVNWKLLNLCQENLQLDYLNAAER